MAEFFAELKRRQIYRVAIAYAAAAWLLLQVFNNLTPIIRLPEWTGILVLALLIGGFPIALVFAWVHQFAPAASAGVPALGEPEKAAKGRRFSFLRLARTKQPAAALAIATQPGPVLPPPRISIAVLPFANMSGDASQEFFSDGMTEEITAALAKVPDLRVVARTSAFQFKSQNRDIKSVGEALHATHLIEGSVRKDGNQVRITAQLIKADDGTHMWAENYDRQLTGVFAIQEDIAHAIAGALRVSLGLKHGELLVSNRTGDTASYQDYLQARTLFRQRTLKSIKGAEDLLEKVVARDPNYAPAWEMMAQAYSVEPHWHRAWITDSADELRPIVAAALPRAEEAAHRAIRLDPGNAGGYAALGYVEEFRGRLLSSEELYLKSLELDGDDPFTLHHYSLLLAAVGRVKEAVAMRQRLIALEPLVPVFKSETASVLWLDGQNEAAIAMLKEVPNYIFGTTRLSKVYASLGRYEESAAMLSSFPAEIFAPGILEEATRLLRSAPTPVSAPQDLPRFGVLEYVYVYVGAPGRALELLEDGAEEGFLVTPLVYPLWHRDYRDVRKLERFKTFLHRSGLIEYWRAKGWPSFCRPTSGDDFICE
jgi:TolB-like protein